MANSDSFINEVTEEVRRDQLFGIIKRWAWLAALIVVGLVGSAAYFEIARGQAEAEAQAFGDALITALETPDAEARLGALEAIEAPGAQSEILLALMMANEVAGAADTIVAADAAAARLRLAAQDAGLDVRYRDLALLKAELLAPSAPDEARATLGALAMPGAPYAALAEEQLAYLDVREGNLQAGIDRLRDLEVSAAATPALQQRAGQMIVALESGAALVDVSPEPVEVPVEAPAEGAGDASGPADASTFGGTAGGLLPDLPVAPLVPEEAPEVEAPEVESPEVESPEAAGDGDAAPVDN